MDTVSEFDLKAFQSAIYRDYTGLIATVALAAASKDDLPGKLEAAAGEPSILVRGLGSFLSNLGQRADENILQREDYIAAEKRAAELIAEPEIKKRLCLAFKSEMTGDLFKEAGKIKWVKAVTHTLTGNDLSTQFAIQRDVRLFALIALQTSKKGITKYCGMKDVSFYTSGSYSKEIKEFQNDVFEDYQHLLKTIRSSKGERDFTPAPDRSLHSRIISSVISPVRQSVSSWYLDLEILELQRKKAADILANPEVKDALCLSLLKLAPDLYSEELAAEVIRIVTRELTKQKLAARLSIEREKMLFTAIVHKLISDGVSNYCE